MKRVIIGGVVIVALVGVFILIKSHSAPQSPPPSEAATAEQAAPAEVPPAGETIIYNIQVCVIGKATVAIDTDRVTWNGVADKGPPADDCGTDMQGKILITSTRNGEAGWADNLEITSPGARLGPIKVGLPGKELISPPTLDVLAGSGTVTLTHVPGYPNYRAEISFDEPSGYTHLYSVALTLQYK